MPSSCALRFTPPVVVVVGADDIEGDVLYGVFEGNDNDGVLILDPGSDGRRGVAVVGVRDEGIEVLVSEDDNDMGFDVDALEVRAI